MHGPESSVRQTMANKYRVALRFTMSASVTTVTAALTEARRPQRNRSWISVPNDIHARIGADQENGVLLCTRLPLRNQPLHVSGEVCVGFSSS